MDHIHDKEDFEARYRNSVVQWICTPCMGPHGVRIRNDPAPSLVAAQQWLRLRAGSRRMIDSVRGANKEANSMISIECNRSALLDANLCLHAFGIHWDICAHDSLDRADDELFGWHSNWAYPLAHRVDEHGRSSILLAGDGRCRRDGLQVG